MASIHEEQPHERFKHRLVDSQVSQKKRIEALLSSPRDFVADWLRINTVTIDARGHLDAPGNQNISDLVATMWLDYSEQRRLANSETAKRIKGFVEGDMLKALSEVISRHKIIARDHMVAELSCKTEDLSEIGAFMLAITCKAEPVGEAVIAHWIWQARRKMNGMASKDHLMIILRGHQGSGKTEAIKKFTKPVEPCVPRTKLNELIDSRYQLALEDNFVAVFDAHDAVGKF